MKMNDTEDKYGLKPVWAALFDVYKEVAKICDRHGLRYYVTDGTAIGAVRHHGFIPWDDDFDMSMPREDYEKFIDIARCELPQNLKFVNWENTPEFPLLFGKVQETRRQYIEKVEKESGRCLSNGIFVDIFPIDGYPESRWERMWTKLLTIFLAAIVRFRCTSFIEQTCKGKLVWLAGFGMFCLMPWMDGQRSKRMCERFLRKHPFAGSRICGRASLRLTLLNRKPLLSQVWGNGFFVPFYGDKVPVPEDCDAYLRLYYGDYMKLPPEEKRRPAHQYSWRCPWWLGPTRG